MLSTFLLILIYKRWTNKKFLITLTSSCRKSRRKKLPFVNSRRDLYLLQYWITFDQHMWSSAKGHASIAREALWKQPISSHPHSKFFASLSEKCPGCECVCTLHNTSYHFWLKIFGFHDTFFSCMLMVNSGFFFSLYSSTAVIDYGDMTLSPFFLMTNDCTVTQDACPFFQSFCLFFPSFTLFINLDFTQSLLSYSFFLVLWIFPAEFFEFHLYQE